MSVTKSASRDTLQGASDDRAAKASARSDRTTASDIPQTIVADGDLSEDRKLTESLAVEVMGWRVARGRFLKAHRSWIPVWRFAPLTRLEDAFQLLNSASRDYTLMAVEGAPFRAEVRVGERTGVAKGGTKPRVIVFALVRALGWEV